MRPLRPPGSLPSKCLLDGEAYVFSSLLVAAEATVLDLNGTLHQGARRWTLYLPEYALD